MTDKSLKIRDEKKNRHKAAPPPRWYYIILFLIPVLFFVIFELSLRLFDYGEKYEQFITYPDHYPDKYFLNPGLTKKYFTNLKEGPSPIPDGFDIIKRENSFRVFLLGGSSAAGWPYPPNASISRQLKRRLELLYPDNTIEVINCGISAINSYTIRDFIPDIIKQKPDLIIIYAGHNEYYGALGVASSSTLGQNRWLINTYIWLQQFRTAQLIQNIIKGIYGWFGSAMQEGEFTTNETLMARMIGESLIPYKSELFYSGLEQFEGNLHDILKMFKDADVPVIIGSVTSNLKDLKPFISLSEGEHPSAEEVFKQAQSEYELGNYSYAAELFLKAKELDALRFRAPKKVNEIIASAARKFGYMMTDIDSVFKSYSPNRIVGYNLTVDHLHPNIDGYNLIAKSFFEAMEKQNYLPAGKRNNLSLIIQDSVLNAQFPFTGIDSVIAHIKLITLIGAYPFAPRGSPNHLLNNFRPEDVIDSSAMKVIRKEMLWEEGHYEVAKRYYYSGDYDNFLREMNAVIEERPFNDVTCETTINLLIDAQQTDRALPYLHRLHKLKPSYFTNKWIGQIYLVNNNYTDALLYLGEASKLPEADFQLWYNLAGAYYYNNKIELALSAVKNSLALNPNYHLAKNFYEQLKTLSME